MPSDTTNFLYVPLELKLRYSTQEETIAKPRLDLSGAPVYQQASVSPSAPSISDRYLTQGYQSGGSQTQLPAGLYLHWLLPKALATLRQSPLLENRLALPAVPNRWLVTRTESSGDKKQWIVESDALISPPDFEPDFGDSTDLHTQYPIPLPFIDEKMNDAMKGDIYQYRFMGRQTQLEEWPRADVLEYLEDYYPHGLTAIGYGDPTFSSVFSNCSSVFGFSDTDIAKGQVHKSTLSESIRYDVLGWYSDPARDCLRNFLVEPSLTTDESRFQALANEYGWLVSQDQQAGFPTRTLLYGSISVVPDDVDESEGSGNNSITVCMGLGGTPSQALNAMVAGSLADETDDLPVLEDQLEALSVGPLLASLEGDVARTFREIRHSRGFKSVGDSKIWVLRPQNWSGQKASELPSNPALDYPAQLADELQKLNDLQALYEQESREVDDLRNQLFCDWYKYQNTRYGASSLHRGCLEYQLELRSFLETGELSVPLNNLLPEIQDASDYMMERLARLCEKLARKGDVVSLERTGTYTYRPYKTPEAVSRYFSYEEHYLQSLEKLSADSLAEAWCNQYDAVASLVGDLSEKEPEAGWVLETQPGPRYWQPTEPGVFLSSEDPDNNPIPPVLSLQSSETLACTPYLSQLLQGESLNARTLKALYQELLVLSPSSGLEPMAAPFTGAVLMEWTASIQPVLQDGDGNPIPGTKESDSGTGIDFRGDYLEKNFQLTENALDLKLKTQPNTAAHSTTFGNSLILTDHSPGLLKRELGNYLFGVTLLDVKNQYLARFPDEEPFDDAGLADWYCSQHQSVSAPAFTDTDDWNNWFQSQFPFQNSDNKFVLTEDSELTPDDLVSWYESLDNPAYDAATRTYDPVDTSLRALQLMSTLSGMSQSLGGFNQALLMQEQVLQLPVTDLELETQDFDDEPGSPPPDSAPGFYRVRAVADGVGHQNTAAPNSEGAFLPWRSGCLDVQSLTLLDSFGRIYTLNTSQESTFISQDYNYLRGLAKDAEVEPSYEQLAYLPPRLSQAAKLDFRWLSAHDDQVETNDHLNSTPVCGWVVPNRLDNSLMVFDSQGQALGSVTQAARWSAAPGASPRISAGQIENVHLRDFVHRFLAVDVEAYQAEYLPIYFQSFMAALSLSSAWVEPKTYAQHRALALYIGRPLALVRARIGVEFQGLAKLNQSYAAFLATLYQGQEAKNLGLFPRKTITNNYEGVHIPIRVGDRYRFNDGVMGYWMDRELNRVFHAPNCDSELLPPQTQKEDLPGGLPSIKAYQQGQEPCNLFYSPAQKEEMLTLLVDPRCETHATCGILPGKALTIPTPQYAPILKRLAVWFLTTPLLTSSSQLNLPLPKEPGFQWAWTAKEDASEWQTTTLSNDQNPIATPGKTPLFSNQELVEGWLQLTMSSTAGDNTDA